MRRYPPKYLLPIVLLLLGLEATKANEPSLFSFSGHTGVYYDFYNHSQQNFDNFRPRYPSNLGRFSAYANLSAGAHFNMPFAIDIMAGQSAYHVPQLPEEGFVDYIRNPRNNIHINPSYKWAQAWLGTQTPSFSSLSTGDVPIFGAGFELNPGRFLFSLHYGQSQIAVNADPLQQIAGAYARRIISGRMGVGKVSGTLFTLNVSHAKDDASSILQQPIGIQPKEGMLVSPLFRLKFRDAFVFKTETALSAFTRNLHAPDFFLDDLEDPYIDLAQNLITINASTQADLAHVSSLEWNPGSFGLGFELRYVGPGYESPAFYAMEKDLIDYSIKTRFAFWEQRVMISGMAGLRTNNLQSTTLESTERIIANLNLFTRLSETFSINTHYSNFGFRNDVLFDTLKIQMIQNLFGINPGLQFRGEHYSHIINAGVNLQFFDEWNMFTGTFTQTHSRSLSGNYQLVFLQTPMNLGIMGMYMENETPHTNLNLYNIKLTARYQMLDKRLRPALGFSFTGVKRDDFSPDRRIQPDVKVSYEIRPKMTLQLGYLLSLYRYGTFRPDARTTEHRMQLSLRQAF